MIKFKTDKIKRVLKFLELYSHFIHSLGNKNSMTKTTWDHKNSKNFWLNNSLQLQVHDQLFDNDHF